jgi:hypothetical protein
MTTETTDLVEYDDPTHTYKVNGAVYPSVTDVLNTFVSFDRVPRDVLERKRLIGRATHACIELHATGNLDPESIDPAVQPYFDSWLKLLETKPLRVLEAEKIVYSKAHRYAGRLDLVVQFMDDGDPWLLDVKSCDRMPVSTSLQTAAYANAFTETTGMPIKKRAGVHCMPDGACARLFPYDRIRHKHDLAYFLNFKNGYTWINNNGASK